MTPNVRAMIAGVLAMMTIAGAAVVGMGSRPVIAGQPGGTPVVVPTSNPTGLLLAGFMQRFFGALSGGDVDGAMASFADTGTVSGIGRCFPTCAGHDAVRLEIEREARAGVRITPLAMRVDPPVVAGEATITSDGIRAVGASRMAYSYVARTTGGRIASLEWTVDTGDTETVTALKVAGSHVGEAELPLSGTPPCIPLAGRSSCDPARLFLWNGDAGAWAVRGVTDADARFDATITLRIEAGDPAAIAAIARLLGWPYVKITRVRFTFGDEVELTNLGGSAQDISGWTLRALPESESNVVTFPAGSVMPPGGTCLVYVGPMRNGPPDACLVRNASVSTHVPAGLPVTPWLAPDAGELVLVAAPIGLVADDTRYDANAPLPPPSLQVVSAPVLLP